MPYLGRTDQFFRAYVECALWSSTGDDDLPLDRDHNASDLSVESLRSMSDDCSAFLEAHGDDVYARYERAGHDFWLTRNGHGSGFWDGDWPDGIGQRLTDAAHKFGESYLYVGDDGLIYVS
jgi:hypothetical protein